MHIFRLDRVTSVPISLWKHVRKRGARLPEHKQRIKNQKKYMEEGLYLSLGDVFFKRWRDVPDAVRRSKAGSLVSTIVGILVPGLLYISHRNDRKNRAETWQFNVAVPASDNGIVFFRQDAGLVGRTYGFDAFSAEQIDLRRRWSQYVPSAEFWLNEDRDFLYERIVIGRHLGEVSLDVQVRAVEMVIDSYTSLCQAESDNPLAPYLGDRLLEVSSSQIPHRVQAKLGRVGESLKEQSPFVTVPSGSDNSPNNVIIDEGEQPVFIDCLPIRLKAFFAHPVGIIAGWGAIAPKLRQHYLAGGFDPQLADLFRAASRDLVKTKEFREALLILSFVSDKSDQRPSKELCDRVTWLFNAYRLDNDDAWAVGD